MNKFQWLLHRVRVQTASLLSFSSRLWRSVLRLYSKYSVTFFHWFKQVDSMWFLNCFHKFVPFVKRCIVYLFFKSIDIGLVCIELLLDLITLLCRVVVAVVKRIYRLTQYLRKYKSLRGFDYNEDLFSSWTLNELAYVFTSFFFVCRLLTFLHSAGAPVRIPVFFVSQFLVSPFIKFFVFCLGLFAFVQQQDVFRDAVSRFFYEFGIFQTYGEAIHFAKWFSFLTFVALSCALVTSNY
jgi:hypothetical protein